MQANFYPEVGKAGRTYFDVRDRGKRLLTVGVLGGEGEKTGDAEGDACGNSLGFDPKRDPGHHHNQTSRDVSVEEIVAQATTKLEDHLQTREIT